MSDSRGGWTNGVSTQERVNICAWLFLVYTPQSISILTTAFAVVWSVFIVHSGSASPNAEARRSQRLPCNPGLACRGVSKQSHDTGCSNPHLHD